METNSQHVIGQNEINATSNEAPEMSEQANELDKIVKFARKLQI